MLALWNKIKRGGPRLKIAVNARATSGPWGGGNQWLQQLARMANYVGMEVTSRLDPDTACILILHSADNQGGTFGAADVEAHRKAFPRTRCIHRINENDARKGTDFMDAAVERMNRNADHTVFVSSWLKEYHAEKWFDRRRPHETIINGADSRFFHPVGSRQWKGPDEPFILVTHHWSDNWKKGFRTYAEVDRLIAEGELPGVALRVIGRWPAEIQWRAAETQGAISGARLADALRDCHAYITATEAEPGAMHYIEGMQCGLPLLHREGGGGAEEVGQATGGVIYGGDVKSAIREMMGSYAHRRATLLKNLPSGEEMALRYCRIVHEIIGRS